MSSPTIHKHLKNTIGYMLKVIGAFPSKNELFICGCKCGELNSQFVLFVLETAIKPFSLTIQPNDIKCEFKIAQAIYLTLCLNLFTLLKAASHGCRQKL